jgi:hypothetical protein
VGWLIPPTARVQRGPSNSSTSQREQADCSSLRASSDHRFIVGALRARRTVCLLPRILLRPRVARAQGTTRLPRFLLRLQHLLPLLEHPIDRLRGTGIQTEAATFKTAGRVKLVGRSREPGAGRADWNTDGLMGAAVGMTDQVIANDHHGFDSFKETLGKDLKHVSIRKATHFHSFTSSFKRSFNSGCCSRLF